MDKNVAERKARTLLSQEGLSGWSYKQLRDKKYWKGVALTGFAHYYLMAKKKRLSLLTGAKQATLLELARFDLALGTTIGELVYFCCLYSPIKTWIESLINLDQVTTKTETVKQVLAYKNKSERTCLIVAFDISTNLLMGFNEFVKDAAESVIYLIELGDQHGVDMVKLLNKTLNNGSTLFFLATGHSEQLALYLLKRGVKVNTLNSNFETPQFKVN